MADNLLPPGFRRLEYMLFLNQPAIFVTDFILSEDDGMSIDYQPLTDLPGVTYSNRIAVACGSATTVSSGDTSVCMMGSWPQTSSAFQQWGNRSYSPSGIYFDGQRHVNTINWLGTRAVMFDGIARSVMSNPGVAFAALPMGIGGVNVAANVVLNWLFIGKLFSVKFSRGRQIARDYVPCLDNNNVLVWLCLLTGHMARRKEFAGATWPEAGPVVPDPEQPTSPKIRVDSIASRILNHLVATLRNLGGFAEVSLAASDVARTATPRADVTFDGLERLALDDAPDPAWRLAAVVRITVCDERNDEAIRRAMDLADRANHALLTDRFRGGLCQDLPRGQATVVAETKLAATRRPHAEVRLLVHCHYTEVST
jgi:hypothetical protein